MEFNVSMYFVALYLGRWYAKNLRLGYLFKPFMLIDLFSLLPLVVSDLRVGAFLRIFRILRIARLLQVRLLPAAAPSDASALHQSGTALDHRAETKPLSC